MVWLPACTYGNFAFEFMLDGNSFVDGDDLCGLRIILEVLEDCVISENFSLNCVI